jgi:hypothetical protein
MATLESSEGDDTVSRRDLTDSASQCMKGPKRGNDKIAGKLLYADSKLRWNAI